LSHPPVDPAAHDPAAATADATVVAVGAVVQGELHAEGAVRVLGRVQGRVRCGGLLWVAHGGGVHADVAAHAAVIAGEVVGDVVAVELVELRGGGRVAGDIRAARVVIADGATLRGTVTLRPADGAEGASSSLSSYPATTATSAFSTPSTPRPAYLAADGGPPPARGLAAHGARPRVFLRRAADGVWQRPS